MKFEKVNNDKIKITLNIADLQENDLDSLSFMSDSKETKLLFLSVLDKAEKDYGFTTDNYHLKVETIALDNGSFILTITRSQLEDNLNIKEDKKRLKVSRKIPKLDSTSLIYIFNSFDDFCDFIKFINTHNYGNLDKLSKKSILYLFNSSYYLLLNDLNLRHPYIKKFCSTITEFARFLEYSSAIEGKLYESAKVIIKNHVISKAFKYFNS